MNTAPAASLIMKPRWSGTTKTLLVATGILLLGAAAAYAQLPEPKATIDKNFVANTQKSMHL